LSVPIPVAGVVVTVGEGGGPGELSPPPPPHPDRARARSNIGIHNRELRYGLILHLLSFSLARSPRLEEPVGCNDEENVSDLFFDM